MTLVVGRKQFKPSPEGVHDAILVDVVDIGKEETQWGVQEKVALVWELAAEMENGRRYVARKKYTRSLHEKSILHRDVKALRARPFTAAELAGFDLETIVGMPCRVLIQHAERDGTIWANVTAVMKADPNSGLEASGSYVRVKDRDGESVGNVVA